MIILRDRLYKIITVRYIVRHLNKSYLEPRVMIISIRKMHRVYDVVGYIMYHQVNNFLMLRYWCS